VTVFPLVPLSNGNERCQMTNSAPLDSIPSSENEYPTAALCHPDGFVSIVRTKEPPQGIDAGNSQDCLQKPEGNLAAPAPLPGSADAPESRLESGCDQAANPSPTPEGVREQPAQIRDFRTLPSLLATCCRFDLDNLLQDPAQLSAFLAAARLIRKLEPEAERVAIGFALRGTEIPGFTLVRHETPGYVDTATLEALISNCPLARIPALCSALAKLCGHVSGDRYRQLCAAIGVNPSQAAIKHAGATPFLRQQPY